MMKRILLFLLTNLGILLVLSVSLRLLGVEPYLSANGLNVSSLLVFAAVMGFGGSFLSLALSKWVAKRSMGVVWSLRPPRTRRNTGWWRPSAGKRRWRDARP